MEILPRVHPIFYHGHLYFVSTFPLNMTILPILLCKLNFLDANWDFELLDFVLTPPQEYEIRVMIIPYGYKKLKTCEEETQPPAYR